MSGLTQFATERFDSVDGYTGFDSRHRRFLNQHTNKVIEMKLDMEELKAEMTKDMQQQLKTFLTVLLVAAQDMPDEDRRDLVTMLREVGTTAKNNFDELANKLERMISVMFTDKQS